MKKLVLLAAFLMLCYLINAQQLINVNPDPKGEPWIAGGYMPMTQEEINQIPELKMPNERIGKDLPESLDNSSEQYFRPVFNQTDGSCAQASGVGYNFTYEMNFARNTSANTNVNQFPTHYTYNYLNGGSGSNGSNYTDGWDIIKANGCPTVADYGGLAPYGDKYWMSGYIDYQDAMANKLTDYFSIDVSTEEGLLTLKNWMFDHLNGSEAGGIVNFSAGVSDVFNMTYNNIITEWGHSVNHAMTFIGWDDNIEYDFNNDGDITTDEDINGDGIIDMRDWERGALIMVNSWGTFWGNGGKAYVMYKLLAEPVDNGGISGNKVYSIFVRESYDPILLAKVKMEHNSRNKIKVSAGIANNLSATEPENEIFFPLFNYQGGDNNMRGNSSDPIEFSLDITPLLSCANSGEDAKFFLKITETDPYNEGSGNVIAFSVLDVPNNDEFTSTSTNVSILNDNITLLNVDADITFDAPEITTTNLPEAAPYVSYTEQLEASGGQEPYTWSVFIDYSEETNTNSFPAVNSTQLTPTSNDDGYATLPLDFDFPFYGEVYDEIFISTDGAIIFEPGFDYIRTESAIMNSKIIGVFASDLMIYPEQNDGIFYEGDQNSATIRWKTSLFDQPSANVEAAVTIYPNGEIEFYYGDNITTGLSWAAGISFGDGRNFSIAGVSGSLNPSNETLSFVPSPFPLGMQITEEGVFQGIPSQPNQTWDIDFVVTDFNNISKSKTITFETDPISVNSVEKSTPTLSCYPNPMHNYTAIGIDLEKSSLVKIEVFDLSGKKIASVANETMEKGSHKIVWIREKNLPNGIYTIQLNIDGTVLASKIIVN